MTVADQMYLIEARRAKRGERAAAIARFILTAGSRYAALSKLRVYYDTSDLDSLTATPVEKKSHHYNLRHLPRHRVR